MKEMEPTRYDVPPDLQGQVAITTLDKIYNWSRRSSLWPLMYGIACWYRLRGAGVPVTYMKSQVVQPSDF